MIEMPSTIVPINLASLRIPLSASIVVLSIYSISPSFFPFSSSFSLPTISSSGSLSNKPRSKI
ncbi:hypothetical protein PENTCL1PPCAC_11402, partial [Pristionchus entomophagus]